MMHFDGSKGSIAAFASAGIVGLTAGVETEIIDSIPKGVLALTISSLFAVVGYFFRRDYKKITEHQTETNKQLAQQKASLDHIAAMFVRVEDKYERTSNRVAVLESKVGIPNG